jgi:glyoxylase-like metal-dependent hydrolase (beta-lactamase superfamily II)
MARVPVQQSELEVAMANTFNVGDLEVLVFSDGSAAVPATVYYQGTTNEQWEPHARWLDHGGNVVFPFGCFLVRSGDTRVLIDTGVGPIDFGPFHGGALLGEMDAAGVKPEEIDVVFLTHLHSDHCGTVAQKGEDAYSITFPNATYRWTSPEDDYWKTTKSARDLPESVFSRKSMFEAVAHKFEAAEDGDVLAAGMNVMSLPGHTPGHAGVVLSSGQERAFLLGDAIGCPVQREEPEWSGMGDIDPKLARQTQEAVAREMEGGEALVGASHFPGLTFGRVLRGEGRRYWEAL